MLSSLQGCNNVFLQLVDHQKNEKSNTTKKSKSKDAAVTHAVAERKRRERINSHLHTLKKLFPHLPKVCFLSSSSEISLRVFKIVRI